MKAENFSSYRSRWASLIAATMSAGLTLATSSVATGAERLFNGPFNPGDPETWASWDDPASWVGGTLPTSEDVLRIYFWQGTAYGPTTSRLASDFTAREVTVNYGSSLYLGAGAALTMDARVEGGDGRFSILGNSRVTIGNGASFSWTAPLNTKAFLEVSNGAVLENRGSLLSPAVVKVLAGGMMLQSDGEFVGRSSSSPELDIAGKFVVTGGVVRDLGFAKMDGGASVAIRGGDVSIGTLQYNSGNFHVDGSGASQIKINSFRLETGRSASLIFTLDHTEKHVSAIRIESGAAQGNSLRSASSLEMRLKGGILLADQTEFALINRAGMSDAMVGWKTGPGPLWKDTTRTEGGRNLVMVALNETARVGELSSATPELVFEAVSQGFVDLSEIDFAEPIVLALDLTHQSSLLEAALTAAGVDWLAGSGDYELYLFLDPSKAGGSYFAWDFHDIDSALGLQGIALGAIPEPGSWALLGLTLGGGFLFYRGRKRSVHFSSAA